MIETDNLRFTLTDEAWRECGYGRRLLSVVEAEAIKRRCTRAWLRTYSFQARGFYEKFVLVNDIVHRQS